MFAITRGALTAARFVAPWPRAALMSKNKWSWDLAERKPEIGPTTPAARAAATISWNFMAAVLRSLMLPSRQWVEVLFEALLSRQSVLAVFRCYWLRIDFFNRGCWSRTRDTCACRVSTRFLRGALTTYQEPALRAITLNPTSPQKHQFRTGLGLGVMIVP